MGEARRRGCFEQRQQQALIKQAELLQAQLREQILKQRDQIPFKWRKPSKQTVLMASLLMGVLP